MENCRIGDALSPSLRSVSWSLVQGEAWAVVGPSGGGKEIFASAIGGRLKISPNEGGSYHNRLVGRTALVSFEEAAAVAERARYADDSDYVEGGVSEGRSVRSFVASHVPPEDAEAYPDGRCLESHPAAAASGGGACLDRGLKRLSTGEWRRVLLFAALASRPSLMVLVEPYAGLDVAARSRLAELLDAMADASAMGTAGAPAVVIVDRLDRVPAAVNRVIELADGAVVFSGSKSAYLSEDAPGRGGLSRDGDARESGARQVDGYRYPDVSGAGASMRRIDAPPLIELHDVTVAWSGRRVLDGLSWTVRSGEHWLVQGPNGSGKTTLLELVTGDNPQAYANDVSVFGRRRGTGETVWDIKSRIGIVSYRLHLEYRRLADMSLEHVLVSGFHDSIGLYVEPSDSERAQARAWLDIAGFGGRGHDRFGSLAFGEQRALLVARAAVKAPELLILDEPCHGLDDARRRFVLSLMADIASRGRSTIIHVTHDESEITPFERHILELKPGATPSWSISVS